MEKPLSLYELNGLVSAVIETTLNKEYWVEAELSEVREVRGHCFMELVQKDENTHTPVAKASAKCWKSTWMLVKPYFERVTGQVMHAGMKVLLRVYANFHEAYGFSWIVTDINPEYTMGDLARRRLAIIRQLKEEGVYDLQRELRLPLFAQRIAVISSEGAAGYGDFCHQLENNGYGFQFDVTLFPAVMQGEQVEDSIVCALDSINTRIDDFDVVVIIRGGGATSDLSGFDTLCLAENVANFPLPIITGIGHERDESILDMVSHTRVKTPTAAASFLIDHLATVQRHLDDVRQQLVTTVLGRLDAERLRINKLGTQIPLLATEVLRHEEVRLGRMKVLVEQAVGMGLQKRESDLKQLRLQLKSTAESALQSQVSRLRELKLKVQQLDPERMLHYGYSITMKGGRVVRDASALADGDELLTKLAKGNVTSIVKIE
ncbi:MAG: exodeoxyribonuclease VII large subunit [Prevotella sp.]|nr:exodeoxyribonuclease VII large subunit [Prevotella sp.]